MSASNKNTSKKNTNTKPIVTPTSPRKKPVTPSKPTTSPKSSKVAKPGDALHMPKQPANAETEAERKRRTAFTKRKMKRELFSGPIGDAEGQTLGAIAEISGISPYTI